MSLPPPRRRGTGLFFFRFFSLAVLVAVVWAAGMVGFAASIPDRIADPDTRTDAIVVLTGGSGRLDEGLELLSRDRADKLFVSGVYRGVDVQMLLSISRRSAGQLEERIGIGGAVDTVGNAAETARWMEGNRYTSLRLVTANYHMPRSLVEFRNAMPTLTIVPHPVFPEHVKQDQWWAWPGTASLLVGEYNKLLLVRLRHLLNGVAGRANRR